MKDVLRDCGTGGRPLRDGDEATVEGSRAVVVIVETKDDPLSRGRDDFYTPRVYKDNTVTGPVTALASSSEGDPCSLGHAARGPRDELIFGGKGETDKGGGG